MNFKPEDMRYIPEPASAPTCPSGVSARPMIMNMDAAARTLHANTHDSWENSKDWEDLTPLEQAGWRNRAANIIKAAQEA